MAEGSSHDPAHDARHDPPAGRGDEAAAARKGPVRPIERELAAEWRPVAVRTGRSKSVRARYQVLPLGPCYNDRMTVHVLSRSAADGRVVSNPAILGGRPVFSGTRVPVATLFEYLADRLSLDHFLESFPTVPRDQAVGILGRGLERIEHELGLRFGERAGIGVDS